MHRLTFRVFILASLYGATFSQAQTDRTLEQERLKAELGATRTTDCPSAESPFSTSSLITSGDYIELQRTRCYGVCPAYKVDLCGWHRSMAGRQISTGGRRCSLPRGYKQSRSIDTKRAKAGVSVAVCRILSYGYRRPHLFHHA
jgi:hypothetical protein